MDSESLLQQLVDTEEKYQTPKGAASHVKASSVEGLARHAMLRVMGTPPEKPESALHGATATQFELVKEKAEHRFVIFLKAQGRNTAEIAEITGYCQVHVNQILAQPWARKQLARVLEESNPSQLIPAMIASAAHGSVATLVEIRDNPKAPDSVRVRAAQDLLDRFLGKAVQQVQIKPMRSETEDDAQIAQRLKQLEDEERDLIARPKVREMPVVDLQIVEQRREAASGHGQASGPGDSREGTAA